MKSRALTSSLPLSKIPNLFALLGSYEIQWHPFLSGLSDCYLGWGRKRSGNHSLEVAKAAGKPYLLLEEGFLRSIGLGVEGDPPLSMVVDDLGIYYDATRPSRLEEMLDHLEDDAGVLADLDLLARARRCMDRIVRARLSKYNNFPVEVPIIGNQGTEKVLVVDQTKGDLSVVYGMLHSSGFEDMLQAALDEHPDAEIIVKTHPDVIAGKKRGYLTSISAISGHPRIHVLAEAVNPIALVEQMDHVYVGTSQLGFEALMVGKPVTCFGVPFYAGWGLTEDRVAVPRRTRKRALEEVFAAAYILYARYVDPDCGERCEIERVIEHLETQRRWFEANAGSLFCFGFTAWKRGYTRRFLQSPGNRVVFARSAAHARRKGFDADSRILVWGMRDGPDVQALADEFRVPVWRMEDGFLRSVGLGSDFIAPASLVLDHSGIYFDPNLPSELERLLQNGRFSEDELAQARALIECIIQGRLTKYQVGQECQLKPKAVPGQRILLVPGQVDDDASVRLGCVDICSNEALIRAVRKACPDGYIIYKPHPEVVAGNRQGKVSKDVVNACCDEVVEDVSLSACLAVADEVHTLTSLVGFDALLRGKTVVTHGRPFYAGWGLTHDRQLFARRSRRLTLEELVAGSLLRYPRYINWESGRFTTALQAAQQLEKAAGKAQGGNLKQAWLIRQCRKARHLVEGVMYAS